MRKLLFPFIIAMISTSAQAQNQNLRVDEMNAIPDYIVGTATNLTNHTLRYASVSFGLYDARGALVGNAVDTGRGIDADGSWHFKAITTVPYDHFKLLEVETN